MQTQNNTTTAVAVWNDTTRATVEQLVNSGASVPKELYAVAPKGFVKGLRNVRKADLKKNSSFLISQLTEKGFKLAGMTEVKTLKSGVQTVSLKMETGVPTRKLTAQELQETFGLDAKIAEAMVAMVQ
jgi:hypothetical protein